MAEQKQGFISAFSSWKIVLAVLLGLAFTGYMLFSSLEEVHFVKVSDGSGTHNWKDSNRNHKIDFQLQEEFFPAKHASYRQKKTSEFLAEIHWSKQAVFWILIAVVCMIGRDLAYMWRIRVLTKKQLSWRSSFDVIMIWEFASALSPGVMSGSTVAMFILNREKIPLGKSTAIVVVTAMMDNLFYVLMIPLIFIFISPAMLFPENSAVDLGVEFIFWLGFGIFFALFVLLFLSIFFYPKLIRNFLSFIFRFPLLKKWRNKAIQTGEEVMLASQEFRQEKFGFWFRSFSATIISWTSRYLVINCILAAFLNLGFINHFFILGKQLVLWLLMRISPTPGGSGIAEYAFGELMSDFSDSAFLLAILAVLWRLISYFPYLLIGTLVLPGWLKKTA